MKDFWLGDVDQSTYEELNLITKKGNYSWDKGGDSETMATTPDRKRFQRQLLSWKSGADRKQTRRLHTLFRSGSCVSAAAARSI